MKTALIAVGFVLGVLLVWRALLFALEPGGLCLIGYQPSILIGFSPTWETALACSGS